jgi:hypothetical protein
VEPAAADDFIVCVSNLDPRPVEGWIRPRTSRIDDGHAAKL